MRYRITAFGVACAFLVCCIVALWVAATSSGCATMNKVLVKDYYTKDIPMGDKLVTTHIPNEVKEYLSEDAWGLVIYESARYYAIRYGITGTDVICDYWGELWTGKDIVFVMWDKHGTFVKGWIYDDKGIPVKADEETIRDLLAELIGQKQVKGDSV